MAEHLRHLIGSVLLGLFIAGPVAALLLALLPVAWGGPAAPWAAVVLCVGLSVAARRRRRPPI